MFEKERKPERKREERERKKKESERKRERMMIRLIDFLHTSHTRGRYASGNCSRGRREVKRGFPESG